MGSQTELEDVIMEESHQESRLDDDSFVISDARENTPEMGGFELDSENMDNAWK